MSHQHLHALSAEFVCPLIPAVILTCQQSLHRRLTPVPLPTTHGGHRYRADAARLTHPTPTDKLRLAAFVDAPADLRTDIDTATRPVVPSVQAFVYPLLAEQITGHRPLPRQRTYGDQDIAPVTAEHALEAVSELFQTPLLVGLAVLSFNAAAGSFERFLLAFALNDSRAHHQRHLHDQREHRLPETHLDHLSVPPPDIQDPHPRSLTDTLHRLERHFDRQARHADPSLTAGQVTRLRAAYLALLARSPDALQTRDRRGNPHLPHGTARTLPDRCGVTVRQERRAREVFYQALTDLRAAARAHD
ncbi:hypothetical protein [Deinococcus aquiradiocola]|uniref:Uncharacterized protein n=1 Tax=Deinococcus aquiradiocola TaxID=393059 RepID=A0A917PHA8_9DEIO|nr:hypothetical protein [Deinococcus aquiradiocola]GGJ78766.1 hypothetical protein GCM10008939_23270 [Deinococcus aquiradiocola]